MNRRNFLKSTAAIGTLATLNLNLNASAVTGGTEKKVASVCEMCSSRCPIEVTVKNGRGALIEGNHRFSNKTSVCARGGAGINQLYDDQRLIKPLIRVGERGEGKFKEASWDEALKICAQRG
nr:molybdopterin-dependent oxidoreductase [uncultured Campylobacter sp.]